MLDALQRAGYRSLPDFFRRYDENVELDRHIGAAIIEFTRQFDPERGDRYAKQRMRYIERQEAEQRRLDEERAKKAAEEEVQRKKDEEAARALYLGWADQMSAMQFGRVVSVLEASIRVDGRLTTRREFVISCLKDGWTPKKEEGVVSYYGSRWDVKESKPKTVYHLAKGSCSYTVTKTEFSFAEYLAAHAECLNGAREEEMKK